VPIHKISERKHVDVLSHAELACHGTLHHTQTLQSQRGYNIIIILGVVIRPGIQSKRHCNRGLSHLNSDKPFWTRRYYTVQEDRPGPLRAVPRSLIIYPRSDRPRR